MVLGLQNVNRQNRLLNNTSSVFLLRKYDCLLTFMSYTYNKMFLVTEAYIVTLYTE